MKSSPISKTPRAESPSKLITIGDTHSWAEYLWDPFSRKDDKVVLSRRAFEELEELEYLPDSPIKERIILLHPEIDILAPNLELKWYNRLIKEIERYQYLVFLIITSSPQTLSEREIPQNAWIGVRVSSQSDLACTLSLFHGMALSGAKPEILFLIVGSGSYCIPSHSWSGNALAIVDWIIIQDSWPSKVQKLERFFLEARYSGCSVHFEPKVGIQPQEFPCSDQGCKHCELTHEEPDDEFFEDFETSIDEEYRDKGLKEDDPEDEDADEDSLDEEEDEDDFDEEEDDG